MKIERFYHRQTPELLRKLCETPDMQRLRHIGMNCGCEYTSFKRFRRLRDYSRYDHSLGTARIVWHFTQDPVQSSAALFHDIATPTFAHSVDFMRGDHLKQEATEASTERVIRESEEICSILREYEIPVEDVLDYHRYPIADNDAPRLSADRLEYTLGNLENYRLRPVTALKLYYSALCVTQNEEGVSELAFSDAASAIDFGFDALKGLTDEPEEEEEKRKPKKGRTMKFGVQSVEITEDELNMLYDLYSEYTDAYGSGHGFATWLVEQEHRV